MQHTKDLAALPNLDLELELDLREADNQTSLLIDDHGLNNWIFPYGSSDEQSQSSDEEDMMGFLNDCIFDTVEGKIEKEKEKEEEEEEEQQNLILSNQLDKDMSSTPKSEKGRRRVCLVDGCSNRVQRHGKCHRHGGQRTCQTIGCNKKDRGRGHCILHGGGKPCKIPSCTSISRKQQLCGRHYRQLMKVKDKEQLEALQIKNKIKSTIKSKSASSSSEATSSILTKSRSSSI